ncbi:MAG: four helix bundle protein [Acidobacteria bacterium]|nr:MAG: four helix bundle protein [Acidobacteriota bacterium]
MEDSKKDFKKRIYQYVLRLVRFLAKLPKDNVLNEIQRQLIKSGTSVGANYFEALAGSSRKDFQNYFSHALKSANESKFWLAVLRDSGLLPESMNSECSALLGETKELANILASSILTMKGRRRERT